MAAAEFAGDVFAEVLRCHAQLFRAVRARHKEGFDFDLRVRDVQLELAAAEFAGDSRSAVLLVDPQLAFAMRTEHEITGDFSVHQIVDLLQFKERWNLYVASVEVRIQQRTAELTVNQIGGHILSTLWTEASGPRGHYSYLDVLRVESHR